MSRGQPAPLCYRSERRVCFGHNRFLAAEPHRGAPPRSEALRTHTRRYSATRRWGATWPAAGWPEGGRARGAGPWPPGEVAEGRAAVAMARSHPNALTPRAPQEDGPP